MRDNWYMPETPKAEDMLGIPISNFFSGVKAEADIYIRLSETKFILLFHMGSLIDMKQVKKYAEYNIKELYVIKTAYNKMLSKQVSVAGMIIDSKEVPALKKVSIINRVADGVYNAFSKKGFEEEAFENAKNISESVVNLVNAKPDLAKLMESLNGIDDEIFKHSMAVSFMAPMLAKKLEWNRPDTLQKISLGGLLHDIGKRELDPKILKKQRSDLTYEEMCDYETHPFRGMEILSSMNSVPQDVIAIVYEHHENSIGQGFPRRLWDVKMHPMARVVALTNVFCELIFGSINHPEPVSMKEALHHIETVMGQPFNKQAFQALKELVEESNEGA
tara:strand:- start:517 stop:1515 length:999 start_codon:yes stop_codon:yes gene_type:complete